MEIGPQADFVKVDFVKVDVVKADVVKADVVKAAAYTPVSSRLASRLGAIARIDSSASSRA